MPTGFDWFTSSLFVPERAQQQVSWQLDSYIEETERYILDNCTEGVNLYLSGSLSRQEPSVLMDSNGQFRLHSDVDLVAVTSGELPASHPALQLTSHLTSRFPEVDVTVLFVEEQDLHQVGSFYGRDLWIGLGHPIAQTFEIVIPRPPSIGTRQKLEVLVHQLGACLLYRELNESGERGYLIRESLSTHFVKLALESLRCLLPSPPYGPIRYSDTYVNRNHTSIRSVMKGSDVGRLVMHREYHTSHVEFGIDVYQCVIESLVMLLGTEERPGSQIGLVSRIEEIASRKTDLMNLFQFGLVLLLLATRSTSSSVRRRSAHFLFDVLHRLDGIDRSTCTPIGQLVRGATPDELAKREPHAIACSKAALLAVRTDYYGALKEHNNGRTINPQYIPLQSSSIEGTGSPW
ncbi:hypothetical protein [Streptomyces hokutonensis]|uniref:Polymerase nucleotidyl transferase domain-containing protein n=1 Tax=Streptomyces hokutonensis TaxID=1306990 RepID=A0ABW6MMB5_9ACTN